MKNRWKKLMDFSEEEIDAMVERDDSYNMPEKRGRAYKRVQRRNKIEKRKKMSKELYFLPPFEESQTGQFAKRHLGCKKAHCLICHYSKILKLPTLKEMRDREKVKEELAEFAS
jgi:hypothetical protein